jgi:hypothetical protein
LKLKKLKVKVLVIKVRVNKLALEATENVKANIKMLQDATAEYYFGNHCVQRFELVTLPNQVLK